MKTFISILFVVGFLASNQSFAHGDFHKSGAHRYDYGHWHSKYHRVHGRHCHHRHHYKAFKHRHHRIKRHYARNRHQVTYAYPGRPTVDSRYADNVRGHISHDHGDYRARRHDHRHKHRSERERRRDK